MSTSFDNVLNDYLNAVEEYFRMKGELEDSMKQGYMDISKARYIMGVTSVSRYQYSNDMTASATVSIDRSSTEDVSYAIDRHGALSTAAAAAAVTARSECEDLSAAGSSGETSVRRRRAKSSHADNGDEGGAVGEIAKDTAARKGSDGTSSCDQATRTASDPLRWFGVLVPPSLRSAQSCFVDALTQVAQLAALQSRCDRLRKEYVALKAAEGS